MTAEHADWMDARAACARLGVKASTLYTYVSRGWVRTRSTGGRRKQYLRADVEALRERAEAHAGRAPRAAHALDWGEPVLRTAISAIDRDGPYYRGIPAVDLVDRPLEEVARILWDIDVPPWPARRPDPVSGLHDLRRRVDALELTGTPGEQAVCIASAVWDAVDLPDHPDLRATAVLCADHELNASTFAARVAASTGADLQACVVAALAAFSGPRHGAQGLLVHGLLERFLADRVLDDDGPLPGFGHRLYPDGDPRGELLIARASEHRGNPRLDGLLELVRVAGERGHRPTLDAGLAATCLAHGLPPSRVPLLFASGRVLGWIAHALEQTKRPEVLRPRAFHPWRD